MKIEKRVLGGALRVLGKVACQNSPVEEYRSIRFQNGDNSVTVFAPNAIVNDKAIRRLTSYHLEVTEPDTIPIVSGIKILIIFFIFYKLQLFLYQILF